MSGVIARLYEWSAGEVEDVCLQKAAGADIGCSFLLRHMVSCLLCVTCGLDATGRSAMPCDGGLGWSAFAHVLSAMSTQPWINYSASSASTGAQHGRSTASGIRYWRLRPVFPRLLAQAVADSRSSRPHVGGSPAKRQGACIIVDLPPSITKLSQGLA